MNFTYARTASTVLLSATIMSAVYQAYRALVGTYPSVDSFGVDAVVGYGVLAAVAITIRIDHRAVWWGVVALMTLLLAYAVVGYYPGIWSVRPMDHLDWLEGTLFTGALVLVLALAVLRLTGTTLIAGRRVTSASSSIAAPRTEVSRSAR